MKLLLIFALVFATSSVVVNADLQDGFLTIFNGIGNVLEDIGDFLQDPQKIKDAAKRVVGTLKHLGKTAKDGFEKLLEDKGVMYISNCRSNNERGGGAALAVSLEKFNLKKLDITIPRNVECIWGILKPKTHCNEYNQIIC